MLWSLSIAKIIFACHSDASWKLNYVLSSRSMVFISKISYSVYLNVFLVLLYFSGTLRSGEEFHLSSYIDRLEIIIVFAVAIVFTLAVDFPMKNIVKMFLRTHSEVETSGDEAKPEEPEFRAWKRKRKRKRKLKEAPHFWEEEAEA
jgi:peptidoglycan/LPS O-acetylase OafA/YrhL